MVQALLAAVLLVGALGLLNLLLTVGAIRRLRQHAAFLYQLNDSAAMPAPAKIGQQIHEFSTTTVDGRPFDHSRLSGETLVGFFSPQCALCRRQLPAFVALARSTPGGPDRVLAAVIGDGEEALDIVTELRPVALVVQETYGGPVGSAFQVRAYPTVVKVAPDTSGRVLVVDNKVALETP